VRAVLDKRLADPDAEQVRRSTAEAIKELQALPASSMRVIEGVTVASNQIITVAHRLGVRPRWVGFSAIRWDKASTASLAVGVMIDYGDVGPRSEPIDRTQVVMIGALGFTSAGPVQITFDLLVVP